VSDQTPSGEGFGQASKNIERLLGDVREALQMDVAFISKFSEDQLVFRALEGDAESFGWQEGESFPVDESYCKRVLDGQIPQMVPDAKREDATKDLRVTSEADMGSYCAVPLVLSDGRLYGTLCCVSHAPDPWLRERDLRFMERTASWLIEHLDRLDSAMHSLGELATRDHLTGAYNRRAGEEHLLRDIARAERGGGTLSLAVLDLDRLKSVNDEHGHRLRVGPQRSRGGLDREVGGRRVRGGRMAGPRRRDVGRAGAGARRRGTTRGPTGLAERRRGATDLQRRDLPMEGGRRRPRFVSQSRRGTLPGQSSREEHRHRAS
jgi:hypothetical protein